MDGNDRLRPLLDVDDLDGTEARLQDALGDEATDQGRAEVLTQLARVASLREASGVAHSLIDEADRLAGPGGTARTRVLLERGRIIRREGDPDAALPLFERAYEAALIDGDYFVAGDAAHMAALAGDVVMWTARGLAVADRYEAAAYWRGTLLINLGRSQHDNGQYAEALASFEAGLQAREEEPKTPFLREYARFGVARALRKLGRPADAIPLLQQVVAWADDAKFTGTEAGEFKAELGAAYVDLRESGDAPPEPSASQRATQED